MTSAFEDSWFHVSLALELSESRVTIFVHIYTYKSIDPSKRTFGLAMVRYPVVAERFLVNYQ